MPARIRLAPPNHPSNVIRSLGCRVASATWLAVVVTAVTTILRSTADTNGFTSDIVTVRDVRSRTSNPKLRTVGSRIAANDGKAGRKITGFVRHSNEL